MEIKCEIILCFFFLNLQIFLSFIILRSHVFCFMRNFFYCKVLMFNDTIFTIRFLTVQSLKSVKSFLRMIWVFIVGIYENSFQSFNSIRKVSQCIQPLELYCMIIINSSCFNFIMNRSNVPFVDATKNLDLPFSPISRYTSKLGTPRVWLNIILLHPFAFKENKIIV